MLKINRRLTVLILVITVASVFLCSCGIALPINLSTSIKSSQISEEPDTLYVNVKSLKPISDMVSKGPSLILVYMITKDTVSVTDNTIDFKIDNEIRKLNESYWETSVDPKFDPQNCDSPLFTYKNVLNDISSDLYAFKPASGDKLTNNYNYYLNFFDEGLIYDSKIQTEAGDYVQVPVSFDSQSAQITVNGSEKFDVQGYDPEYKLPQHVYVFAAITAQGLNSYVSDLVYIGEFN